MHPQQVELVRITPTPVAPGAAPSAVSKPDSMALHRWARRQRSRMVGDTIVRAWKALAAGIGRLPGAIASPATKRNARTDVI